MSAEGIATNFGGCDTEFAMGSISATFWSFNWQHALTLELGLSQCCFIEWQHEGSEYAFAADRHDALGNTVQSKIATRT